MVAIFIVYAPLMFFITLFREIGGAFRYAWLDACGIYADVKMYWREINELTWNELQKRAKQRTER
jgi:hypothetical protein